MTKNFRSSKTINNLHIKPYAEDPKKLFSLLDSQPQGLSSQQASSRLPQFGLNQLEHKKSFTIVGLIADQFKNILTLILVIAAGFSLVIGKIIDAAAIALILIVNGVLGFVQEFKAEKSLEELKQIETLDAVVIRDGKEQEISAQKIVPGDIMLLQEGDQIPADARLLKAPHLEVDESMLTGESTPTSKETKVLPEATNLADRNNMVFSGCVITRGRGKALVVRTGMKTEIGKIADELYQAEERETPLQGALKRLGKILALVSLAAAVPGLVIGFLSGRDAVEMMMMAVSLSVSAIPEGLPVVVTIALAMGIKRMAKVNVLVRKLSTAESLGGTDVICTDKTGTLTHNQMTVTKIYLPEEGFLDVSGEGLELEGDVSVDHKLNRGLLNFSSEEHPSDDFSRPAVKSLARNLILCSDATLEVGDPTEQALLVLGAKLGYQQDELTTRFPRQDEVPFKSANKYMKVAVKKDSGQLAIVKGAAEQIAAMSDLSAEQKKQIKQLNSSLSDQGLRVLALASKEIDSDQDLESVDGFQFQGLVGMYDPPRKEVKQALQTCRQAGIRVIMTTGDHKKTAEAIADRIGFDSIGAYVGQELDEMDDARFSKVIKEANIFARVSPRHKVKILKELQSQGNQVAMTGDGVNDAAAVKGADVGIAVGDGTDLTKGVSDMILLDNNFASISLAIQEGRHIFFNIKKFLKYLTSTNFDEILEVLSSIVLGLPLSLLPLQILWINLTSDSLPALALTADPVDPSVIEQEPYDPKKEIFQGIVKFAVIVGLLDYVLTYSFFVYLLKIAQLPLVEARTMSFSASVLFEFFLVFAIRSPKPVKLKDLVNNPLLLLSVAAGVAGQLAIVYVPFLQQVFNTTALPFNDWLQIVLIASSGFFGVEILKRLGVLTS